MTRVGVIGSELLEAIERLPIAAHIRFEALAIEERSPDRISPFDAIIIDAGRALPESTFVAHCAQLAVGVILATHDSLHTARALQLGIQAISVANLASDLQELLNPFVRSHQTGPRLSKGHLITVWSAPGASGATTIAINLAIELGGLRHMSSHRRKRPSRREVQQQRRVCLIDLDCWAPSIAPSLGIEPIVPGAAAAARLAGNGELTLSEFNRLSDEVYGVHVLSGLSALDRWTELSPVRISALLEESLRLFDIVVVDLGSHSGATDLHSEDKDSPARSAAAAQASLMADTVIGVGLADPIGLARLIRAWAEWKTGHRANRHLVVNRLRSRALGLHAQTQIRRSCQEFLGIAPTAVLPEDAKAADAAVLAAEPLGRVAPSSPLRKAICQLASQVENLDLAPSTSTQQDAAALR